MFLLDEMIHLVIDREEGLLFPQKKGGTGIRNISIMSQHLSFSHFTLCPHSCSPLESFWGGRMG